MSRKNRLIVVGLVIFSVLVIILATVLILKGKSWGSEMAEEADFFAQEGQYQDNVCQFSFVYPDFWEISEIKLPLPQEPLSQVVFDQPSKNGQPVKKSILSFVCYDASQYSFDQFLAQGIKSSETETITVGNQKWSRMGNFAYTVRGDKLVILQMFFTKYDIKPEPGYEETFLEIINSVKFLD
ncbi:MAG: hypothetical protein ACOYJ8_00550 [Patescibacteria group bacterium]|jgi:hypothetical protein